MDLFPCPSETVPCNHVFAGVRHYKRYVRQRFWSTYSVMLYQIWAKDECGVYRSKWANKPLPNWIWHHKISKIGHFVLQCFQNFPFGRQVDGGLCCRVVLQFCPPILRYLPKITAIQFLELSSAHIVTTGNSLHLFLSFMEISESVFSRKN